jgi:phosphatidylserine/phosphatidylglycerophosphate/cardiolipin synthase-like enzyme
LLFNPKILVTGKYWLGADGSRAIGPVLVELIEKAHQEVLIIAYRFTIAHEEFREAIKSAAGRGCLVKLILDRPDVAHPAEERYLNDLLSGYTNVCVWEFADANSTAGIRALHAKAVVVDRNQAVVGSANFSRNGLLENHELAVWLSGKAAKSICKVAEQLIEEGTRAKVIKRKLTK